MKKLTNTQKELLIDFVGRNCEECNKNESEIGKLEIHRIKQGGDYSLRNVKVCCNGCHGMFSSAQNISMGIST